MDPTAPIADGPTPEERRIRRRWSLIGGGLVFLFLLALGLYLASWWSVQKAMRADIRESSRPLTLAEARSEVSFDLPDSAKNIQYGCYSEFIAFIELVRFEAPVEDCKTHALKLVKKHSLKPLRKVSLAEGVLSHIQPLKAPWFRPQEIRAPLMAGEPGHLQPVIWIDEENGVFYYQMTD
jgi:hypothetical protein